MPLQPGRILQNRYRITSLLGQGGMGAVYRALDTRLNAPVALKEMVPQPGLGAGELAQLQQQFKQEAQILAQMSHPYLVGVTDFFTEGGKAYLVMKFVAGESLIDRVNREGAIPERQALEWAKQLLSALSYCHRQGIIHRDIKPHNIIVTPDGNVVLVDFGLVKLWDPNDPRTRTAIRGAGTAEYAPPEQYDTIGGHTDPRSDLYGLGATLYHILTGQVPPTATQRMANPSALKPPREVDPRISPQTERLILKAMEPQPDRRFQSADEMKVTLAQDPRAFTRVQMTASADVSSASLGSAGRARRFPRWVWIVGGGFAFLLLCGIIAGAILFPRLQATPVEELSPSAQESPSPTSSMPATLTSPPTTAPTENAPAETTAAVNPTSTPLPTSTPVPVLTYEPVPLGSAANATLDFQSPPVGDVVMGNVPFELSARIFKSQASPAPNDGYPTSIRLTTDLPQAERVYLLLNTGNGLNTFSGQVIGEMRAYCDGTPTTIAELELGQEVREWHASEHVVSVASRSQQVWSGPLADFPSLTGYIDMLALDLPAACRSGRLTALEVVDTSTSTVGSLDPALNLVGVTVEYYR